MGVSLGLASSASADPLGATAARIEQRTYVSVDPDLGGGVLTGSICTGPWVRCHAHVHATAAGELRPYVTPQGFGPADLQSAYNIDPNIATTPTVVIVDAYGYPTLEADLAAYRQQFNLPACTTASGCLKIVNQSGQASPLPAAPPANNDWTVETALDIDMVSAACPKCKIVVVQATDDTSNGLFVAQGAAAAMTGANAISNSWGGPEQGQSALQYETYFQHTGLATFVSAGDTGYNNAGAGPSYPATSANVIAVGGTSLVRAQNARGWSETAWAQGGSACSLSVPKPAYQGSTACTFKAATDIAAVGDPATGVAVYNKGRWTVVGGTSASAPLVAAIFAATGNGDKQSGQFIKDNAAKLYDVTTGSNGACGNILCTAGVGWDGPTGWGTPNAQMFAAAGGGGSGSGSGSGSGGGGGGGGGGGSGTGDTAGTDVVGGCSAGGSGVGLAMLAGFAVVLVRRRRR